MRRQSGGDVGEDLDASRVVGNPDLAGVGALSDADWIFPVLELGEFNHVTGSHLAY
jgi:hypothetical protein